MRPRPEKTKSYAGISDLERPSQTSRILTPLVVVTTVAILAIASIVGVLIGISIFSSRKSYPQYIGASEGFVTVASVISTLYLFLHCLAAYYNDPIGVSRPPDRKIHALCFIVARLALLAWMIALITSTVVVSKPSVCQKGGQTCRLQIVDVIASALAFLACGVILTALESCQHPFQAPRTCSGITCRISSFGDDILDRPVSSYSSTTEEHPAKGDKIIWHNNIKRKPVQATTTKIPGEFPEEDKTERPLTPLLPPARTKSKRQSWGQEWKHLADEASVTSTTLSKSISSNSISSNASSGSSGKSSTFILGSDGSVSKRQARTRTVTPSSSISNLSRRSPLSTMRYAEYPDILIRPELYVLPPKIPPPHEWSTSRTEALQQLLPVVELRGLQRRPSEIQRRPSAVVAPLAIRKDGKHPSLRRPSMGRLVRRTTLDVKIPGAYMEYRLTPEDEAKVEEHARKIEVASLRKVERRQRGRANKSNAQTRIPGVDHEKMCGPRQYDSRSRYRDTRPVWAGPQRSTTLSGLKQHPPENWTYKEAKQHSDSRVRKLRRLTLGDIDVELGNLWEI